MSATRLVTTPQCHTSDFLRVQGKSSCAWLTNSQSSYLFTGNPTFCFPPFASRPSIFCWQVMLPHSTQGSLSTGPCSMPHGIDVFVGRLRTWDRERGIVFLKPKPETAPNGDWVCWALCLRLASCSAMQCQRPRWSLRDLSPSVVFSLPCDLNFSCTPLPFRSVCRVLFPGGAGLFSSWPVVLSLITLPLLHKPSFHWTQLPLAVDIRLPPVSTGHSSDHAAISWPYTSQYPKILISWPAAISPSSSDLTFLAVPQCLFQTPCLFVSSLNKSAPQSTFLLHKLIQFCDTRPTPILCKLIFRPLLRRPGISNDLPLGVLFGCQVQHVHLYPQVHLWVISFLSPQ
jgi:hypothetical protein